MMFCLLYVKDHLVTAKRVTHLKCNINEINVLDVLGVSIRSAILSFLGRLLTGRKLTVR